MGKRRNRWRKRGKRKISYTYVYCKSPKQKLCFKELVAAIHTLCYNTCFVCVSYYYFSSTGLRSPQSLSLSAFFVPGANYSNSDYTDFKCMNFYTDGSQLGLSVNRPLPMKEIIREIKTLSATYSRTESIRSM